MRFIITGIVRVTTQVELESMADGRRYYFRLSPQTTNLDGLTVGAVVCINDDVLELVN